MVTVDNVLQSVLGFGLVSNLTSLFGPYLSPQAQILLPTDEHFQSRVQQRWTNYKSPSYSIGAIKPATPLDVQRIVQISNENEIPFLVTGGGHGTSDYTSFDGLSIDLSQFNGLEVNKEGTRLTIGGATKIHQLIKPLADIGRELPLGSCACVGVVGATLGGGIGGLHGHRGLLIDLLKEVDLITAQGNLIKVSSTQKSDLFWALRGAGANYGIVLSATYELPEISNNGQYVNADFVYPARANRSFFSTMQAFDEGLPSRLAITAVSFFNRETNEPVIAVNAIFYGTLDEADLALAPFKSLQPTASNISSVPAEEIMDAAFFNFFGQDNGACTPNQHINIYTLALKQFHGRTFEAFFSKLVEFWHTYPDFQGRLLMQRYSNAGPLATPDDASAYPHREAKTFVNIEGFYPDSELDAVVNDFSASGRSMFAKTSGYDQAAAYVNYARGDEGALAWYGDRKLPKLAALKREWDPQQRFSVSNPVPLYWPPTEL